MTEAENWRPKSVLHAALSSVWGLMVDQRIDKGTRKFWHDYKETIFPQVILAEEAPADVQEYWNYERIIHPEPCRGGRYSYPNNIVRVRHLADGRTTYERIVRIEDGLPSSEGGGYLGEYMQCLACEVMNGVLMKPHTIEEIRQQLVEFNAYMKKRATRGR